DVISQSIIPKLYMSAAGVYGSPIRTSGATYGSTPYTSSVCFEVALSKNSARPKSVILVLIFLFNMFPGCKSRCIYLLSWITLRFLAKLATFLILVDQGFLVNVRRM